MTQTTSTRRSLIVNTAATRKAYDQGRTAAQMGRLELPAYYAWQERNMFADWFDGDAEDAWNAGYSDTAADAR